MSHPAIAAGRTAVITGGASGIGLATASRLATADMNVCIADVDREGLANATAALVAASPRGDEAVLAVPTDVSQLAAVEALRDAALGRFGEVALLMNNAGTGGGGGPWENYEGWQRVLGVNLWGVIHGVRVFLPGMKARDEGHIVVTASVAGLTSYPWLGPYNTTKHGAVTICETLFSELREAGSNVKVSCLCPGAVATSIGTSERNRPKELANAPTSHAAPGEEEISQGDFGDFSKVARPPAEVAELVLAAVLEERFWIETDAFYREPIKARHRAIENLEDPPARGLILAPYVDS